MENKYVKLRVNGIPQPTPKKEINMKTGITYPRDYRTRRNELTGKIEKYDKGYKERWFQKIRIEVEQHMKQHNIEKIEKGNGGVFISISTFIIKPKNSKYHNPETKPDNDNYAYRIKNILQGICYDDDSQIIKEIITKNYTTIDHPVGVEIQILPWQSGHFQQRNRKE